MRFSRSRRKSGPGAVLSGFGRALVLGVLILIALKADAPKRLLELYQSLLGAPGQPAAQEVAGGGDTPKAETPSVAAGGDDRARAEAPEDNASETESVAASSATGVAGIPGAAAASDRKDDETGDAPLTSETIDASAIESGDVGSLDVRDVRSAESSVIGFGDDEAAAKVSDVSTEAGDAAGYEEPDAGLSAEASADVIAGDDVLTDASTESTAAAGYDAPDAQGLILTDEPDISDRESGDVGAAMSAAGTGLDTAGTAAPAGQSGGSSRALGGSSTPGDEDAGHTPGMVTEDEDAVPGDGTTECPEGFPIKGNGRSRLYHMPEGFAYPRTKPELCFRTPEAAEKAGFRRAKG